MLTEPLPHTLDIRKAAKRGLQVEGVLRPQNLVRFRPLLASDRGSITAQLDFYRDEESRSLVRVIFAADIEVICQRCLEPMPEHLAGDTTLTLVWTDEEAAHLPRDQEALIVTEQCNPLWDIVEDELILAMPPFSYHNTDACKIKVGASSASGFVQESVEDRPNPFAVLGQLKPGNKH